MLEREDGPVKHYYAVCDKCGKKTRRQAWGWSIKEAPKGWVETDDEDEPQHYCPKCATGTAPPSVTEAVPKVGNVEELSDREEVSVPLKRTAANTLVIDLGKEGGKFVITSETPIKVEKYEE